MSRQGWDAGSCMQHAPTRFSGHPAALLPWLRAQTALPPARPLTQPLSHAPTHTGPATHPAQCAAHTTHPCTAPNSVPACTARRKLTLQAHKHDDVGLALAQLRLLGVPSIQHGAQLIKHRLQAVGDGGIGCLVVDATRVGSPLSSMAQWSSSTACRQSVLGLREAGDASAVPTTTHSRCPPAPPGGPPFL